jgi:hypothetical protein
MGTQEVAEKLVAYCREGKNIDAINELYADGIVSNEAKGSSQELTEGKIGVLAKNQGWFESVAEIHGVTISDPLVTGNFFAVGMDMDVTYKKSGRMAMKEVAVYEARNGKVVSEHFFYTM